eukprot:3723355-Rhodomonas_salina.4
MGMLCRRGYSFRPQAYLVRSVACLCAREAASNTYFLAHLASREVFAAKEGIVKWRYPPSYGPVVLTLSVTYQDAGVYNLSPGTDFGCALPTGRVLLRFRTPQAQPPLLSALSQVKLRYPPTRALCHVRYRHSISTPLVAYERAMPCPVLTWRTC